jgi:hypothetical protein
MFLRAKEISGMVGTGVPEMDVAALLKGALAGMP